MISCSLYLTILHPRPARVCISQPETPSTPALALRSARGEPLLSLLYTPEYWWFSSLLSIPLPHRAPRASPLILSDLSDPSNTTHLSTLHARRHPPSPPLTSGGRAWVRLGVGGRGLKSQVPWHAGSTPHTPWQHAACHTHPYPYSSPSSPRLSLPPLPPHPT